MGIHKNDKNWAWQHEAKNQSVGVQATDIRDEMPENDSRLRRRWGKDQLKEKEEGGNKTGKEERERIGNMEEQGKQRTPKKCVENKTYNIERTQKHKK